MNNRRAVKRIPNSLQQAIEDTVKNPVLDMTIEEIADECNVCPSMVYRWMKDPDSNSYAKLTVDNLRKLLDTTQNTTILDYFERRHGRIAIKVPKGIMPKGDEGDMIDDYRTLTIDAIQLLLKFFKQPTKENKRLVDVYMEEVIKTTASIKRYADKKAAGQFEMEL